MAASSALVIDTNGLDILSSDDEDTSVADVIAQLQNIIDSNPELERSNLKCGVRSYWTDVGGYLHIHKKS